MECRWCESTKGDLYEYFGSADRPGSMICRRCHDIVVAIMAEVKAAEHGDKADPNIWALARSGGTDGTLILDIVVS